MSLPTAQEVTNLFLYNDEEKPTNIVDAALIRPESDNSTRQVDANEFMEGPGRFALAAMSNLVKKIFYRCRHPRIQLWPILRFE